MTTQLTDMHCHSSNSFDAKNSVAEMAAQAVKRGLGAICITDHCDLYPPGENKNSDCFDGDPAAPIIKSVNEVAEYRAKNSSETRILKGVELGQPTHNETAAKELLSSADFDFVLCSLHNLYKEEDFFFMDFTKLDANEILIKYFTQLLEICEQNLFDSLAHICYPVRYIVGKFGLSADLKNYWQLIDKILQTLIKNEKSLEYNTSPIRNKIDVMDLDAQIFRRYRELGGEYVTVGSDAHDILSVGADVARACSGLAGLGFKSVYIYESRRPEAVKL